MSLEARAVAVGEPRVGTGQHPEPEPPHSLAPRRPRTVGGAVFLVVLAVTLVGVGVVALSDWQAGLTLCGAALIGGGVARLVLPNSQSGMLGVRRKLVDVATLLVLGAGLVVLAAVIPPLPAA